MRLLATFTDPKEARAFAAFLTDQGVAVNLEEASNTDWGSDEYGVLQTSLWIIEEDDFETAYKWLESFQHDPNDPIFQAKVDTIISLSQLESNVQQSQEPSQSRKTPVVPVMKERVTLFVLILCILVFVITQVTAPRFTSYPPNVPLGPLFASPTQRVMMYDWPEAYAILSRVVNAYGMKGLENPASMPPEGKYLLNQFHETPYWHGIYDQVVSYFKTVQFNWNFSAPMFEKIGKGELWRLITPCFLHADIFHILFNMLWLVVLGRQIEPRLGVIRYIILIVLSGIISNTAQYLMSGSNFIGFSGVVCAMIAFIWTRQKVAPWEGYQLQAMTRIFIALFILAIFGLQILFFVLDILNIATVSAGIANTAHIVGAVIGFLLARSDAFSWQKSKA
ncbi:MAG: rhomboid family intramembrane serine protease [Chlamydiales bacterium]|nr:rhomboid family intramembrane serine protease [Chlamydiia bacterium]MCP5507608.1 rhomboid family intramembrane serine protease [Chlamydiales bacterium]